MMRRLLLAILIVAGACTQRPDSRSARPGPKNKLTESADTSLEFWCIDAPQQHAAENAIEQWQNEFANVTINRQMFSNDMLKAEVARASATEQLPDVFNIWVGHSMEKSVNAGQILNLTESLHPSFIHTFHPAALNACSVDSEIYAVPVDVTIITMWYNRDIFAENGLLVPKDFNEFMTACNTLRQNGIVPVALGNAEKWPGTLYFLYFASRLGGTNALKTHRFATPALVQAGRFVQEMANAGAFNADFNRRSIPDSCRAFLDGETAMILIGSEFIAQVYRDAPHMLDKLGHFPFPASIRAADPDPLQLQCNSIVVGRINSAYAANAKAGNIDACVGLLEYLSQIDTGNAQTQTGYLPARPRTPISPTTDEFERVSTQVLSSATVLQTYDDQLLPPSLAAVFRDTCGSLLAGTLTPLQAAQKMDAAAARVR